MTEEQRVWLNAQRWDGYSRTPNPWPPRGTADALVKAFAWSAQSNPVQWHRLYDALIKLADKQERFNG